jgi:hypothetical protein
MVTVRRSGTHDPQGTRCMSWLRPPSKFLRSRQLAGCPKGRRPQLGRRSSPQQSQ